MEKETEELNMKNTKLIEENSHMYDSYEEKIRDMSQTTLEGNYIRDLQEKKIVGLWKELEAEKKCQRFPERAVNEASRRAEWDLVVLATSLP